MINNGNRTEWSPIPIKIGRRWNRSPICQSLVWLQTELDDTKFCYQLIITIAISEKKNCFPLKKTVKFFENATMHFSSLSYFKNLKNLMYNALRPSDAEFFKYVFSCITHTHLALVTKERFVLFPTLRVVMRCSSASTKTSADIREEEYDRKYDDKNKKRHHHTIFTSFPQLCSDEEWVPWLFLRHSDHKWFWWVP